MAGLNVTIDETNDGKELVIRVPIDKNPQPSASGKTLVLATSRGNHPLDLEYQGKQIVLGFNAYITNDNYVKQSNLNGSGR